MTSAKITLLASACLTIVFWSGNAGAQSRKAATLLPPVSAACISSPFGPRILPNQPLAGSYHYGVDLPAPAGAPVLATGQGTVIRIQNKGPGGLEMLVQHDGFIGVYSHLGMVTPAFAQGKTTVAAGEKLGVVGNTGITSGMHLYFGMLLAGKPVDPAPYLGVPQCNGELRRALAGKPVDDGQLIGARKYYQLFLPERQYYQWKQR